MLQTQTDAIENINIENVDLVALNGCLERGLTILKTECNGWPKMIGYLETTGKDLIDDKTIKISIRQNPSFGMVITCSSSNTALCKLYNINCVLMIMLFLQF